MEKTTKNQFQMYAKNAKRRMRRNLPDLKKISQTKMTWTYDEKLANLESTLEDWRNDLRGWAIVILHYADRHPNKVSKRDISLATSFGKDGYIMYRNKSIDLTDLLTVEQFLEEKGHSKSKPEIKKFRKSYSDLGKLSRELSEIKKARESWLSKHKSIALKPAEEF